MTPSPNTPAPAADSEDPFKAVFLHFDMVLDELEAEATKLIIRNAIAAQNDATYAALLEALKALQDDPLSPHESEMSTNEWIAARRRNKRNTELRQSIAKIFGKETDSPAGAEGDLR